MDLLGPYPSAKQGWNPRARQEPWVAVVDVVVEEDLLDIFFFRENLGWPKRASGP